MSKIKIYDGVIIDMGTSKILELGKARYVDSSDIVQCGGGGGSETSTSKTISGYADEYSSEIKEAIGAGYEAWKGGTLGQVADFTDAQKDAHTQGIAAAGQQTGIEKMMYDQAMRGTDLSGMRQGALQQAQGALGLNAAGAGRAGGLGGSRQAINQGSITNDLAAKFGQIDLQKQQQDMALRGQALGVQGAGAESLAAIGAGQQAQEQRGLDKDYSALSQLSNIYGSFMPKQTDVESTKESGGK